MAHFRFGKTAGQPVKRRGAHSWLLRAYSVISIAGLMPVGASTQEALTWQQIRDRFEATNPALQAARIGIDESRAQEITAYLRPNPSLNMMQDGTQINRVDEEPWLPFASTVPEVGLSYLRERRHKRELRRDSAREGTAISESTYLDQQRTLLFTLRDAFVLVLQAKAVLENAKENLGYWDRELEVDRSRFKAGDLSQSDLSRLELQRVQFEADFETATVNLRTNKIQLLMLLNDRTPVDQFDVTELYDFKEKLKPLEEFRNFALTTRPDLRAAMQSVHLAKINHQLAIANGSTDPTLSAWWSYNPSFNLTPLRSNTLGTAVNIPLRIFDRNQGEKLRTQLDVGRSERLRDANQALVLSDVDSAYWTLIQALNLLRPYKAKYLPLATDIRERIAFSYRNGGASLLEYLDAEKSYRDTRLAYLNLIGSYMTAAAQMNMAVGREVIQ